MCASAGYKPILELYYTHDGYVQYTVEQGPNGPNQPAVRLGQIPIGTTFSYELRYEGGMLSAGLNGDLQTAHHYDWVNPLTYFQAGNYNQASDNTTAEVHFRALKISH